MKISQYLGKRCWLMLFALTFGFSSLSISYANFDFQGDEGANSLTGRGDRDDDRGDYGRHKDKKHHGHHYNDRDDCDFDDGDDLGACSDKKLSKGHITLCKESNCPEIGIVEVCKKSKHLDKFLAKGYFLQTEFVEDNDGDGLYLEGSEVVSCESPGENYIVKEGAEVDCDDSIASGSSCVAGQNQCGDDLIGENQCVDGAIACTNAADIPEPMVEVFLYANVDGDSASVNNGSEQRLDCNEDGQPDSGLGSNEGLEPLSVEDCDDTNADAQEGVLGEVEACDDGVDNNCNGQVDENCEPVEVTCPCSEEFLTTKYTQPVINSLCSSFDSDGNGYYEVFDGIQALTVQSPEPGFEFCVPETGGHRAGDIFGSGVFTCQACDNGQCGPFNSSVVTEEYPLSSLSGSVAEVTEACRVIIQDLYSSQDLVCTPDNTYGILGTAPELGFWSSDVLMDSCGNDIYRVEFTVSSGADFKARTAGNWSTSYGTNDPTATSGALSSGSGAYFSVPSAGTYVFTMDLNTLTYTIELQ